MQWQIAHPFAGSSEKCIGYRRRNQRSGWTGRMSSNMRQLAHLFDRPAAFPCVLGASRWRKGMTGF